MARAKKRIAERKNASKRKKASGKPVRKKVATRATLKKRSPKTAAKMTQRKAPMAPVVEDTIIDVIDEPIPGVVRVAEYETIRTTTAKRGASPGTKE
jgi:hypothetical protein